METATRRVILTQNHSSIAELGLAIFTASLAALRPLLKFIPWGSLGSSKGQSYKKSALSRNQMGPSIKLSEIHDSEQNTSEEFIVPRGKNGKRSERIVTHSEA